MICCSRVASPALGANSVPPKLDHVLFAKPTPPENDGQKTKYESEAACTRGTRVTQWLKSVSAASDHNSQLGAATS